MSFLYIKTELSAKIFEYDIIKEQFENIFTKNADKILKKYEYYLNITNKNIVFNETYMGKEVILNKVKELTKNYIITEVVSEIFENGASAHETAHARRVAQIGSDRRGNDHDAFQDGGNDL